MATRAGRRPMASLRRDQAAPWRHIDWVLLGAVGCVAVLGLLMVFSATRGARPPYHYSLAAKQLLFIVLGAIAGGVVALIDYHHLRDWAVFIYVGAMLMLLAGAQPARVEHQGPPGLVRPRHVPAAALGAGEGGDDRQHRRARRAVPRRARRAPHHRAAGRRGHPHRPGAAPGRPRHHPGVRRHRPHGALGGRRPTPPPGRAGRGRHHRGHRRAHLGCAAPVPEGPVHGLPHPGQQPGHRPDREGCRLQPRPGEDHHRARRVARQGPLRRQPDPHRPGPRAADRLHLHGGGGAVRLRGHRHAARALRLDHHAHLAHRAAGPTTTSAPTCASGCWPCWCSRSSRTRA